MDWKQISKLDFTEDEMKIVDYYCKDNMRQLKKVCIPLITNKNVAQMEYDDLYSDALNVLIESVKDYKGDKSKFSTYLIGNIKRSFYDWTRDRLRWKRCNLETDENGKVKKDGSGLPIPIKNIPLDAPNDDGTDWSEKIESSFDIESETEIDFNRDENVELFLNSLSKLQKNILLLKMDNIPLEEIKEKLHISDGEYLSEMKSIQKNKKLSLFTKNKNDGKYKYMEVKKMADRIIKISESESYRTDKYSMYSLIQDKKNGDMNCNYILQREPFQWTDEEANRYFCRILSNLPIPEIIICEQKKKGLTVSHLIDGLQRLSYAESFKENRRKIGAKGAERHLIQYRDYVLDENGNRVLDEDGLPEYEMKVFDVIGKYYKDLPDELKKRFNNFNINVTKFFDCTDEQIADHIRDYNNHASMNKEQGGLTKISSETAGLIKYISQKNTFFKNCGKFSDNNVIKGKIERIVAEAIMLLFFRDSWKSNLETIYKFVDENATEQQFLKLNSQFNRLELALGDGDNNKKLSEALFTPTTMPMWIAVFDKFTTYNLDDSLFVGFLAAYNTELKNKEVDGVSMADFKEQQTKKKTTITGKIDLLVKLMNEYLHIDEIEENETEVENNKIEDSLEDFQNPCETGISELETDVESNLSFVKKNGNSEATNEDIEEYKDYIDDTVRVSSPLYRRCYQALLALVSLVYKNETDKEFAEWIEDYANNTYEFSDDQIINLNNIKEAFDSYMLQKEKGATA
jgi:RNA polymerase sigma factor (sigma-70 family)